MILEKIERLSQLAKKHRLRIQVISGGVVCLFIMALSRYQPPEVVVYDEKIVPEYTQIEALSAPSFSNLALMTKIPVEPVIQPQNSSDTAPSGWYPVGQCTHYVWSRRPVPGWGNATSWLYEAKQAGWTISDKPIAGAIGWTYGHVVYVESVQGSTVTISEANYDWRGSIRTITVPTSKYTYLY